MKLQKRCLIVFAFVLCSLLLFGCTSKNGSDRQTNKTEANEVQENGNETASSSNPFVGTWDVTKVFEASTMSVKSSIVGSFVTTIKADGKWSMEMSTTSEVQNSSGTWETQTKNGVESCILNEGSSSIAACVLDDDGSMQMMFVGRDNYMFILEKR